MKTREYSESDHACVLSITGDENAGSVHSRKHEVAINWYSLLVSLTVSSWMFYKSSRLTQCSLCCCLVSAVHGAHRRVNEELEPCSTAVKILQDVFGELPKNTESKDDTTTQRKNSPT